MKTLPQIWFSAILRDMSHYLLFETASSVHQYGIRLRYDNIAWLHCRYHSEEHTTEDNYAHQHLVSRRKPFAMSVRHNVLEPVLEFRTAGCRQT